MLESQTIKLRPVSMDDLNDLFEYAQDPDVGPRAGWPPHQNIETTLGILNKWLDPNYPEQIFAIVYKQNNKTIGTIGITLLNKHLKRQDNYVAIDLINQGKTVYEIGLTISKAYWGKGVGSEAISLMTDYIFKELNADIVMALHSEANIGSKRIQEKNNFNVLGTFEGSSKWYNTDCTTKVVRGKTKEEWLKENNKIKEI